MTFGHGTASEEELVTQIRDASIVRVADVRTVPKSRRLPHVWREQMEIWVPRDAGAEYIWLRDLGGFRKARLDSRNVGLRNESFRGYADYMETPPFRAALQYLLQLAAERRTAIMCSETLWWRCHRRLIADAATLLHDVEVLHLLGDGSIKPHVLTDGVRRIDNVLRYEDASNPQESLFIDGDL